MNDTLKNEADYFGSIIQDLVEQNKRYREAMDSVRSFMEADAIMLLSYEDRLRGIDEALKKHYGEESK